MQQCQRKEDFEKEGMGNEFQYIVPGTPQQNGMLTGNLLSSSIGYVPCSMVEIFLELGYGLTMQSPFS